VRQRVEFVGRDRTGIVSIVTSSGVIDAATAIDEIRGGRAHFEAGPSSFDRAVVTAREAYGGPYLFANWDGTRKNNLHELAATTFPRLQHEWPLRQRSRFGSALVRLFGLLATASGTAKTQK
jgi:hypothetical protein